VNFGHKVQNLHPLCLTPWPGPEPRKAKAQLIKFQQPSGPGPCFASDVHHHIFQNMMNEDHLLQGLLVVTQDELTTTIIHRKVPFLVRASSSSTLTPTTSSTPSANACLSTFESHQPSVVHPIQYFDTEDGIYLRDVFMDPPTFADSVRSGEAKKHVELELEHCGTLELETRQLNSDNLNCNTYM
jgi:hypothetical protein